MRKIPLWVDTLVVLIFIVLFCSVIIPTLRGDSAYFDEGYSAYLAHFNILQGAYYTALDVHPPLYYVTLHVWRWLFGSDIVTLRLLSVLWASVCIIFAFLITRRAFSRRAAWTVLPLFTFSPLFIRYSGAARMYTMALAVCLATTYILVRLHTTNQAKKRTSLWIVYGVLVAMGMWTNYFTMLVWLSHAVWIIYEQHHLPRKKNLWVMTPPKEWAGAILLALVLYIPWLPSLLSRYGDIQSNGFWIKPFSLDTVTSTLTTMTVFRTANDTTSWLAIGVIAWSITSIWLVTRTYHHIDVARRALFRLIIITSLGPIILLILLSLPPLRPAYTYRYVLTGVCMTMLLVGTSLALSQFKQHTFFKRSLTGTLLIGVVLIGAFHWSHQGNRNLDTGSKSTIGQVFERIGPPTDQIEPVIIVSPYTYFAGSVYETVRRPVYYVFSDSLKDAGVTRGLYDMPDQRGIKNVEAFMKQYKHVWIVGEGKKDTSLKPPPSWKTVQTVIVNEPDTNMPSSYAIEYSPPHK